MKKESSPVLELIRDVIALDRKNKDFPIYMQIAQRIMVLIQNQSIAQGDFLPGTRALAELLKVHRKTIIAAIEFLSEEEYVEILPNKGAKVSYVRIEIGNRSIENSQSIIEKAPYFISKNRILETEQLPSNASYFWNDGILDERLFFEKFATKKNDLFFENASTQKMQNAYRFLSFQYLKYIHSSQNLNIAEENILLVNSLSLAIEMLLEVLISAGDCVVTTNPGAYKVNMLLQQKGVLVKTVPMTTVDGIDLSSLKNIHAKNKIKLLYLEPQAHYPTTSELSLIQRIAILQFAQENEIIILENSSEGALSFSNKSVPSLYALDEFGWVIQVNSLEKSVSAQLFSTYILGPNNLILELEKLYQYLNLFPVFGQIQFMTQLLQSQQLEKILTKNRKIYKLRRDHFFSKIAHLPIETILPKSGLAFWISFPWNIHLPKLKKSLAAQNVYLPDYCLFQSKDYHALRLGYAHWDDDEQLAQITILERCLHVIGG
ncbi:aminotransferase-like domain-containing protein [Rhizosphaericola mali]|uniref:PLP-dependent aminotransferase family protein n=1 Tax=Rhizosphaericola mali TaxID=2545455 RepID=A0A5P2G2A2_9BACT|nr:PLP-dependent aminotransferase family protein [Rhizosphaericola mali]QES89936.1 PLP-dependent aminotransferase family protein [Rhizosphaericola mali]